MPKRTVRHVVDTLFVDYVGFHFAVALANDPHWLGQHMTGIATPIPRRCHDDVVLKRRHAVHLEQTMDCPGLGAGRLGHALGGAASRGAKHELH
jgi:hypothetical protein